MTNVILTDLEKKVLKAINISDYGSFAGDVIWTWDVSDNSGLKGKTFSGVVSSLTQKGMVSSFKDSDPNESTIWLTAAGIEACKENDLMGHYK